MTDENAENECFIDRVYEGGDAVLFTKVISNRFGGDKNNLSSILSTHLYPAMFSALSEAGPRVKDGGDLVELCEALGHNIANIIVNVVVNVSPPRVHKDLTRIIVAEISGNVFTFLSKVGVEQERDGSGNVSN